MNQDLQLYIVLHALHSLNNKHAQIVGGCRLNVSMTAGFSVLPIKSGMPFVARYPFSWYHGDWYNPLCMSHVVRIAAFMATVYVCGQLQVSYETLCL